jgi:hypothetical protein
MQRMPPKPAPTFAITDFSRADQDVLRAAHAASLPMAYIALRREKPCVMAVGFPGAIALPESAPDGAVPYYLRRIRGINEPPGEVERSDFVKMLLKR